MKDAVRRAGDDRQHNQRRITAEHAVEQGTCRQDDDAGHQDVPRPEPVDEKAHRHLQGERRAVENRHQKRQALDAVTFGLMDQDRQRGKYQLVEMAEEMAHANYADDADIAAAFGKSGGLQVYSDATDAWRLVAALVISMITTEATHRMATQRNA
jgi:hypothetical protein